MLKIYFYIILISIYTVSAQSSWLVKKGDLGEIVSVSYISKKVGKEPMVLKSIPEYLVEGPGELSSSTYEEIIFSDDNVPSEFQPFMLSPQYTWVGSEVRTLVNQGPSANRIDLTIVGDGYTDSEKEKFFADAQRITDDLFAETTFSSYLPLFNVHAVFVPSKDSGITDVQKKNTALGLYRTPKGSKRSIFPGNTTAIDRAISLAPDADYPILMANDDFYGGLGGKYAITTRSELSGSMVLRHELGHNFGDVGEEYDGGSAYMGANSSSSKRLKWNQWVDGDRKIFDSEFLSGDYVWQDLNKNPYQANFNFPQGDYSLNIKVSSVGWRTDQDVKVTLDGEVQKLDGVMTADRSFHYINKEISSGRHIVKAEEQISDGDNTLAFIQVLAEPKNIIKDKQFVGGYSTFNSWGRHSGYRPTYDTCLMRNMSSKEFCSVDKENMWIKFLARVELLDLLHIDLLEGSYEVVAHTPPLEGLQFSWYRVDKNGKAQKLDSNTSTLRLNKADKGEYRLELKFETSEVRKPTDNFIHVEKFVIDEI